MKEINSGLIQMSWDDFGKDKNKNSNSNNNFQPPEFKIPNLNFPKNKLPIYLVIIGVFLVWIISDGFYTVQPSEVGVVVRLGKYHRTTTPGFHFKWPAPIEIVEKPRVSEIKREEVGFRIKSIGPPARYRDMPEESLMLTGDENIIDIDVVVQYKISDPVEFLFNVVKRRKTLHMSAEAAIREVIGSHKIDQALTEGKSLIEEEIKVLLQNILNKYKSGFFITVIKLQDVHPPKQVKGAFKDVASAREDKNRLINEAEGYRNAILPEARGEASKILNEAQGYRAEKINHAKGDADRFLSILKEYSKNKKVTRKRLYLEAMEEVLSDADKYIVNKNNQVMPLLHLGSTEMIEKNRRRIK